MAFDYVELSKIAAGVLQEFGQSIMIEHVSTSDYDPARGTVSVKNDSYQAHGCVFNYASTEIDGARILEGDMVVLLESLPIVPAVGDLVHIATKIMRIINVERLCPAGIDVVYRLQVRE